MENTLAQNKLANFFNKQRENIEAAETPFTKLAVFILPIISPMVPASMTGFHIYKLLLEIFTFTYSTQISLGLAAIIAIVFELLGYVGAVLATNSLFRLLKKKEEIYVVPFALNLLAYLFYLVAMWKINVELGRYFETNPLISNIISLLSFITVPTSLLAASNLSQKEDKEDEKEIRREKREERLERERIRASSGKVYEKVSRPIKESKKVSGNFPTNSGNFPFSEETFQKLSNPTWRKIRPQLDESEMNIIANLGTEEMKLISSATGFTYKTISNWRTYSRQELDGA